MTHDHRYYTICRVTIVSAIANALLGLVKIVVGVFGYSHALIADGVHSFADLLTDALVLLASKAAHKNPDREHPYGHGRIETLATAVVATLLIMVGLSLGYHFIEHVIHPELTPKPTMVVFVVAVLAIIVNELSFRYGFHYGKKINSDLVISNAWHHRSDGWISVVVLISILGVYFGLPYGDVVGAFIIALLIIRMGLAMILKSVSELIDTGIDAEKLEQVKAVILKVSGVLAIHQLRTRSLGGEIFVDVHVLVDSSISVSEGHYISDRVWFALRQEVEHVHDVVVHVDPEDDEVSPPSSYLPDRPQMERALKEAWASVPAAQKIIRVCLHYCAGQVNVDVYLPLECSAEAVSLQQELIALTKNVEGLGSVVVFFMSS